MFDSGSGNVRYFFQWTKADGFYFRKHDNEVDHVCEARELYTNDDFPSAGSISNYGVWLFNTFNATTRLPGSSNYSGTDNNDA